MHRLLMVRPVMAFLSAVALISGLLSGSLPLSGSTEVGDSAPEPVVAPVQVEDVAPLDTALLPRVYLPIIMRPGLPSPGDELVVSWAQMDEGGRKVLLHWRTPPATSLASSLSVAAMTSYQIDRRIAGTVTWATIGHAGAASNATEMEAILGPELTQQLGYDLGEGFEDPLTAQEVYDYLVVHPSVVQVLAQRFYKVGIAFGVSFLDTAAPGGVTLEYQVRDLGPTGRAFEPASVPASPTNVHPPFDLRETWEGPEGLGQAPSPRPEDAEERYSWQTTSKYRPWDGKVYLIWNTPDENFHNTGKVDEARKALNIGGYRVYRAVHGNTHWVSINPRTAKCATAALCEMLVGVAPYRYDSAFPIHYFVDDLHSSAPDPDAVYDTWDYKVCAVDGLGQDIACSEVLAVNVRELQPPIAVQDVRATVPTDQSKVTVTWTYSDALELSPPLRFYLTRSPSLTLPLEEWTVVKEKTNPVDYIEIPNTGPAKKSVIDYPPLDQVFWYRVQVRDDAGNWSAASTPVKGARFTRTAPSLRTIPHDATNCENNDLPLLLSGLADNVFLINLYRSFDQAGPFELLERFEVTQTPQGNYVTINDDFLPAYPAYAYYRLEAVDDHGNVSTAQRYCAQLGDGPLMDPGQPIVETEWECKPEQGCTFTSSVEGTNPGDMPVDIEIGVPGEDGTPITMTVTITDSYTTEVNEGAWVNLREWYGYGDPTISDTLTTYEHILTNEFLDTNRNLAYLGALYDAEWISDTSTTPETYYVRVTIDPDDAPSSPVALFRRSEHGNWMQVSPVGSVQPHYFDDRADPSPDERYEYLVVVLSPNTHELLGFWNPVVVDPLFDATVAKLSGGISPPDPVSPLCSKDPEEGPSTLALANGWTLTGVTYWIAAGGDLDCPEASRTEGLDYAHAFGAGTLSNGTETWSNVEFQDIAISESGGGMLVGGRIVKSLWKYYTQPHRFEYVVIDTEFTATDVRAEVEITLPPTIKADIPTFERARTLFGVFSNLKTSWEFDPLRFPAGAMVLDESLPWLMYGDDIMIDEATLDLGDIKTAFRGTISGYADRPDSNLALMRPEYESPNAVITVDGLAGDFATGETIQYTTSFPAQFFIKGSGAMLSIADSEIQRGEIYKAQAFLDYNSERTSTDYVIWNHYCDGADRDRYSLCQGYLDGQPFSLMPDFRKLEITPEHVGGPFNIGRYGVISATVTTDQAAEWPSFSTDPAYDADLRTLFIAPMIFPDAPTSWAPMPCEAAWQRIPDPKTGGNFEPGLNFNSNDETIYYYVYPEQPAFEGSAMNLYVRKGGVSGHLIMIDAGSRTNLWGYSENVQRIELVFLDNKALDPPVEFITDLNLPYPTDATLPLYVAHTDAFNRPLDGGFREEFEELTHRYWAFTEVPVSWVYAVTDAAEYTQAVKDRLPRILQMLSSTATVPGLQPSNADPDTPDVELLFNSEWLPDGDIGALRLLAPVGVSYRTGSFRFVLSSIKLSRYRSSILDPDTIDPSTLGIDLATTMDTLPPELLDEGGNLTSASLLACANEESYGCGLVALDGDIGVDYFGEVKNAETAASNAINANIPMVDELVGEFPLAVNYAISVTKFIGIQTGYVPWIWPVLNSVMDVNLPVKILGNTEGGIIVVLLRDATLFPGTDIFRSDVAGIIDIRWDLSTGYNDMVGMYLGYGASQAAFRALAQNRPDWSGGILPYDNWSSVSGDIQKWSTKFGYTRIGGSGNDPVDLAEVLWEDRWCDAWSGGACTDRVPYNEVFDVLEPVLKGLDGDDAYGVKGVEAGSLLEDSNVEINTMALSAVFRRAGLGLELTQLEGAGQVVWYIPGYDPLDLFIRVDWISFCMDRDGQIDLTGDVHANLLDIVGDFGLGVDGHVHALATPVGEEWRFEGVANVDPIDIAGLTLELDGTFGMGPYVPPSGGLVNLYYFGGNLEAEFKDVIVGGGFLYGVIPSESEILREAGFGEIMDTLGDQGSYEGIYVYLFGDFPIAGESCLMEASAGGEIRFWYYWGADPQVWGGGLSGYVYATVACVISARGQLDLEYARLDHGGVKFGRTCGSDVCDIYGGDFWIAIGVGWCSPSTWRHWKDRWWGDSWCYTFGAYVDLSYMDPGGVDYHYDLDFE